MKWVAIILMGILMMSCATEIEPVVKYTQKPPSQYEIDRKKGPVITHRELPGNRFEITLKSGSEHMYWGGCLALSRYSWKLCEGKTGRSMFKTKKTEFDTRSNNAIWTHVRIIECIPRGTWVKENTNKSERNKDIYECDKDTRLFFPDANAPKNTCNIITWYEEQVEFFEYCMRAKGYELVEISKKEDLKTPDKIK